MPRAAARPRPANRLRATPLPGQRQQVIGIFQRAEVLVERHVFRQIRQARPRQPRVGHRVHTIHLQLPGHRQHKAQQRRQRGRLTRAVTTQQRIHTARRHLQVQPLQYRAAAVGHVDVDKGNGGNRRRGRGHGKRSLQMN